MRSIGTDYLVVGAGAMGMAFTDTLVAETDARVVVVDRGPQPGGHWLHAYPFVRLHQPSAGYGVNSQELGSGSLDRDGWNEGLYELATGDEVCSYFDRVMQQDLLPTGRVQYFPMSEYLGHGRIRDGSGTEHVVDARRRIVDATFMRTVVPSMRPPAFPVAAEFRCVPPNDVPAVAHSHERFVIIGAGKTGIDVCLWLLGQDIAPDRLTWIMPRDSWLLDRANLQPGQEFAERFQATFLGRLAAIEQANSVADLFEELENNGNLLRIDPAVLPTMYRCATVSRAELAQLRRIGNVVRHGRVERIEAGEISLTNGALPADPLALYVDCTADGLQRRPPRTVFSDGHITLQSVRGCQQVFSASFIAHVENAYPDDAVKNDICTPLPHPDTDLDWLTMTFAEHRNQMRWTEEPDLMDWLGSARLNLLRGMFAPMLERPQTRERLLGLVRSGLQRGNAKLEELVSSSTATGVASVIC